MNKVKDAKTYIKVASILTVVAIPSWILGIVNLHFKLPDFLGFMYVIYVLARFMGVFLWAGILCGIVAIFLSGMALRSTDKPSNRSLAILIITINVTAFAMVFLLPHPPLDLTA